MVTQGIFILTIMCDSSDNEDCSDILISLKTILYRVSLMQITKYTYRKHKKNFFLYALFTVFPKNTKFHSYLCDMEI